MGKAGRIPSYSVWYVFCFRHGVFCFFALSCGGFHSGRMVLRADQDFAYFPNHCFEEKTYAKTSPSKYTMTRRDKGLTKVNICTGGFLC